MRFENQLCTLLGPILDLAKAHGVANIKTLPGAWEIAINDAWYLAANGQDEEIDVSAPNGMAVTLPPYHFAVWYNGWLAGLFSPYGGEIAAGEAANEQTLIRAIRDHIARLPGQAAGEAAQIWEDESPPDHLRPGGGA